MFPRGLTKKGRRSRNEDYKILPQLQLPLLLIGSKPAVWYAYLFKDDVATMEQKSAIPDHLPC